MSEMTKTTVAPITRPVRIVLPGGSGHLGKILARHFHSQGHRVTVLTRTPMAAPWRVLAWDGVNLDRWVKELDGADILINLTGRSVNCRYSAANRREILESRIGPTRLLGEAIKKLAHPPRLWMNASTATIYRHSLDRAMDESTGELGGNEPNAPSSWRFSIDVATRWEECFFRAETPKTHKVALRSAVVMSAERGGPFDMLLRLVRFGLGGAAGSGDQFISWVHEADFVRAVEYLIASEDIEGVVNVAAPCPLPNWDFMGVLREAWGQRFGLNATAWMLEFGAAFLRTETELILKSRWVVPGRLLDHGFRFQFAEWSAAAQELVRRWRNAAALEVPREVGGSFGGRPVSSGSPG
jgi:uncharacterized protein (TIGR01777 family)